MTDFAERYGPWSVVAGASDGVGLEFARQLAHQGVNVVMLARRTAVLQEAADSIRADTGTQTLAVSVDLAEADGVAAVKAATNGFEVGLFVYNAGADTLYKPFLETPIDTSVAMINRNCVVPTVLCHHFAHAMVQRGRGGIIIVSSASGEAGGPNAVIYGGTKAYDTVMAEGLWTELHEKGVDVLALILGATDTPSLRRLLVESRCSFRYGRSSADPSDRLLLAGGRGGDRQPRQRPHLVRRGTCTTGCTGAPVPFT